MCIWSSTSRQSSGEAGAARGAGQGPLQCGAFVQDTAPEGRAYPHQVREVGEGVAVDHGEIGDPAGLDRAEPVRDAEDPGRLHGHRGQGLRRRHPVPVQRAQGQVQVQPDRGERRVGAQRETPALLDDPPVHADLPLQDGALLRARRTRGRGPDGLHVPGRHQRRHPGVGGQGRIGAQQRQGRERGGDEIETATCVHLHRVLVRVPPRGRPVPVLGALGRHQVRGQVLARLDAGGAQVGTGPDAEPVVREAGRVGHQLVGARTYVLTKSQSRASARASERANPARVRWARPML